MRRLIARVEHALPGRLVIKVVLILAVLWMAIMAGLSPQIWLLLYVAGGIFLLSYSRPRQVLLAYLGALPFLPVYVGVELPFLLQVSSPRAVGALVMAGVLFGLPAQDRRSILRSPLLWTFIPFLMELLLIQRSLLIKASLTDTFLRAPVWLFIDTLGPALLVSVLAQGEEWRRALLRVLLVSGTIAAVLAIFESVARTNIFLAFPLRLPENAGLGLVGWPMRFGLVRAIGAVGQPSYFGWLFATLFVLSLGAHSQAWARRIKIPWYARGVLALLLLFLGVFSTASGVPFLSMIAGTVVFAVLRPRNVLRPRMAGLLALVLVLLLASPLSTQVKNLWASFMQIGDVQEYDGLVIKGNIKSRFDLRTTLWPAVEESPLIGYGSLEASGAWNILSDIPNRYVIELLNGGFLGLLLWLVPIALAMRRAWLIYQRSTDPGNRALAVAVLSSIVVGVSAFYGMGFGYQSETFFWMMVGLAWALPRDLLEAGRE